MSVSEILSSIERFSLRFAESSKKLETVANCLLHFLNIVTLRLQPSTLQRTIIRERGDDKAPVQLQYPSEISSVKFAVVRI